MAPSLSPSNSSYNMSLSGYVALALVAVAVRSMLSLGGHSGQGQSPMFGDFEAQRHWLEVTFHLPIEDWYRQTPQNDLQYWGLDYPPLTAYVSWLFAYLASVSYPPVIAWMASRGIETIESKFFMRCTVIICDMIVFIPVMLYAMRAVIAQFQDSSHGWSAAYQTTLQLSTLLSPGLLLIDHGHFQYNGVCLGLAIAAAYFLTQSRPKLASTGLFAVNLNDVLASVFFCLSLNFKQMSLYYSPVFFLALLYKCILYPVPETSKISVVQIWIRKALNLFLVGMTVILVFASLWAPFCIYASRSDTKDIDGQALTCTSSLLHVLSRQFPFSRGLFEDKVSNIWYAISVIVDLRFYYETTTLVRLSLAGTLLFLSPVMFYLCRQPLISMGAVFDAQQQRRGLASVFLALSISAFAFFLLSFQVHEKSILLVLLPAALLMPLDPTFVRFLHVLGTFSMFPLLVRDKLRVQYLACLCIYWGLTELLLEFRSQPIKDETAAQRTEKNEVVQARAWYLADLDSLSSMKACFPSIQQSKSFDTVRSLLSHFMSISYLGMAVLHLLELGYTPPARYPDLYPALFAIYCAGNFVVCYMYLVFWLYALVDSESHSTTKQKRH